MEDCFGSSKFQYFLKSPELEAKIFSSQEEHSRRCDLLLNNQRDIKQGNTMPFNLANSGLMDSSVTPKQNFNLEDEDDLMEEDLESPKN
jgi:hypothetical protein